MLYVLFGIPALIVGLYLVALGPTGWFAAAFLVLAVMATNGWLGGTEPSSERSDRTNCPACGAPNSVDCLACGYCDEPLVETARA